MEDNHCSTIVDLCTGSGEPAILLQKTLREELNCSVELMLTDKFPNKIKADSFDKSEINYLTESIDATAIPDHLQGFRTLFASFHHFKPEVAQAILQDAVNKNQPIGIFEFTERNWTRVLFMVPGTLHALAITPFIKPFSWPRLFWTYIVPIIPLVYFWDGLISNLRTYSIEELNEMISGLENNHFSWEVKNVPAAIWPVNITYVIGQPSRHGLTINETLDDSDETLYQQEFEMTRSLETASLH